MPPVTDWRSTGRTSAPIRLRTITVAQFNPLKISVASLLHSLCEVEEGEGGWKQGLYTGYSHLQRIAPLCPTDITVDCSQPSGVSLLSAPVASALRTPVSPTT